MSQSSTARRLLDFSRLFAAGEYPAALAVIDELVVVHPNGGPIHWQRARTLEKLERYGEAREAVRRVLELRREFAPAWVLRAELGEEGGDYDPEPDLRRAIALDPQLGRARYVLALVLKGDEGREDEARTHMDDAIVLDPALHEALAARGGWSRIEAYTDQAPGGERIKRVHLERALADFDRAIAVMPLANYRFARADLLHHLQRYDEAMSALDGLLAELHGEHPLRILAIDARNRAASQRAGHATPEAVVRPDPDGAQASLDAATPQYVPTDSAGYPAHQRAFEKAITKELAQLGFRKLGDYHPAHLAPTLAGKQMLSLYVRDDGEATATAFSLKADSTGFASWFSRSTDVIEFETTFSDGTMVSTNNSGSLDAPSYGPKILQERMAHGTPAAKVHATHVARVKAHALAHPGRVIRRLTTFEEVNVRRAELGRLADQRAEAVGE